MDLSKPPKDVLGLGKHLVRELDIEDGVDTLGRWMAHHLAELMHDAKKAKTVAKRTKAKKQAVETIIKIWEHRKSLQREAYPLAEYKDLLKVIDRLRLDSNPYGFFGSNLDDLDIIASSLFDNLTRLILALLLIKFNSIIKSKKEVDEVVIEALDDEEKRIILAINEWYSIFPTKSDEDETFDNSKEIEETKKVNFRESSIKLIESIEKSLTNLREQLQD